jgi:hypothetical protein
VPDAGVAGGVEPPDELRREERTGEAVNPRRIALSAATAKSGSKEPVPASGAGGRDAASAGTVSVLTQAVPAGSAAAADFTESTDSTRTAACTFGSSARRSPLGVSSGDTMLEGRRS